MKESKLIASIVVFKELHDNNKDIYDIISEFIKATIGYKKIWSFNSTQMQELLKELFDFKIPEAVVKTALKRRLVKSNSLKNEYGKFVVNRKNEFLNSEFDKKYNANIKIYNEIEEQFVEYFKKSQEGSFKELDIDDFRKNLAHYLLGNSSHDIYNQKISAYIIQNKMNIEFMEKLNSIKEGLILYTGVRYTADLNELGVWNDELTIFLDTDILFNMAGYDGIIYKEIFDDFYKIIQEINQSSKKRNGNSKIHLKYFSEVKDEIDKYFHVATVIVEGKTSLDPSKTAMAEIVNGCSTKSDIIVKKNKFFVDLKTKGIFLEDKRYYYVNHQYNIEDSGLIEELHKESQEARKEFNEENCKNYLKQFTKINVLRRGKNEEGFNKCKYILITNNRFVHYLAHNERIKEHEYSIPFATDISFATDKFWFSLKKGFGHHEEIPRSFNIVTRAQIVLSSQINNTVQEKYTALNEQYKSGKISKDEAISLSYELRESSLKPEDISENNIQNTLVFINEFTIEQHIKEKALLHKKAKEGEDAIMELKRRDIQDRSKRAKLPRTICKTCYYLAHFIIIVLLITLFWLGYIIIQHFKSPEDTLLSIIGFIIGIISLIPIIKLWKKADRNIRKKVLKYFNNTIAKY